MKSDNKILLIFIIILSIIYFLPLNNLKTIARVLGSATVVLFCISLVKERKKTIASKQKLLKEKT